MVTSTSGLKNTVHRQVKKRTNPYMKEQAAHAKRHGLLFLVMKYANIS